MRLIKWAFCGLATLLLVPVLLVLVAFNIPAGQRLIEQQTAHLTGGMVILQGLGGSFPTDPRIARLEIHDAAGAWLTIDDIALDWSPLALLHRDAHIDRLTAGVIALPRLPQTSPTSSSGDASFSLPVRVDIDALTIGRLELGEAVAGTAALLAVQGQAHLASLTQGTAELAVSQLDGPGRYRLSGSLEATRLAAHIALDEPTQGLLAHLARLPDLGALSAKADLDGPRDAAALQFSLAAGPLRAAAHGKLDLTEQEADLDVTASAPHMAPGPGISWDSITLDAHAHGKFTSPDAAGHLQVSQLAAGGAAIRQLTASLSGNAGQVSLEARAEGLRIPGPKPDLLADAPLQLSAQARLDAPDRPVRFAISHTLLNATGNATTAGAMAGQVALTLPELAPFAAAGGVALQGSAQLDLKASTADRATNADLDGQLRITGGQSPIPALLGDATLGLTASLHGQDITVPRLAVDGSKLKLSGAGGLTAGRARADFTLALADLAVLAPTLAGSLQASGHVDGPTDDLSAQARVDGDVTIEGHRGPLTATLTATGLPAAPSGRLQAQGSLDNAPLSLDVGVQRDAGGTLQIAIDRTEWKTARIEGALTLAPGATLPQGKLTLRMTRLADLRPLIGQDIAGGIDLTADLTQADRLRLQLTATNAGLPGTAEIATARLAGEVRDPTTHPVVDATLALDGLRAGAISGTARLVLRGPQDALSLRLDAGLHGVQGADATIATAATIDAGRRQVGVASLQADWKGLAARLLAPARIDLAQGVKVEQVRLGIGQAELDVSGRASPTLDLTASVRRVTPALARLFMPDLQADGALQADARLTGTPARPTGTIKVSATGMHMRTGPGASLPPASLSANAELQGSAARLDVKLAAGATKLAIAGQAPLGATGTLDLRATGALDLAVLDPLLSPQGRRLRGQLALDATATGALAAPRLGGTIRLSQGDLQDFTQGVHLSAMRATIEAAGDTLHIAQFSAQAGQGTITASGTAGVLQPSIPVDIIVTARHAMPLASDLLTAVLDGDITLRGQVRGALTVGGSVRIESANIQVPETLPTSLAVLKVEVPGAKPPPPPAAAPDITLNLDLQATQSVFVRGRGLDSEFAGKMHVGGTAAAPRTTGGFQLRRGSFNLAGVSLNFASGEISFNGSSKIDPSLDFVANSSNGSVTATLTVGGYASAPKITLSSVPDLPQDEVLAYLLFRTSAANLSAFQLAEIAAALAQISGVTGGMGDPLASARKALGLDQLNVGTSSTGAPTLNAGRYVAKGVFVGAKQGIGGNAGTQATVQIDITKRLKLETDAGSGPGGNSIGLTYQFEY